MCLFGTQNISSNSSNGIFLCVHLIASVLETPFHIPHKQMPLTDGQPQLKEEHRRTVLIVMSGVESDAKNESSGLSGALHLNKKDINNPFKCVHISVFGEGCVLVLYCGERGRNVLKNFLINILASGGFRRGTA